jgi:hypothetical protein
VRLDIVILSLDGSKILLAAMIITTAPTITAILLAKMYVNILLLSVMITILVPLILVSMVGAVLLMNQLNVKEVIIVMYLTATLNKEVV